MEFRGLFILIIIIAITAIAGCISVTINNPSSASLISTTPTPSISTTREITSSTSSNPSVFIFQGISMLPNIKNGTVLIAQSLANNNIETYNDAIKTGYTSFGEPGDVIIYRPFGDSTRPVAVHRAMYWVNQGDPMWTGGPQAPSSGYITMGDNNHGVYDQMAPSICYEEPVKIAWIIGIARPII